MKVTVQNKSIDFPFENYCTLMVEVVPKEDFLGIGEIRFVEKYSHPKSDENALGCYLQGNKGHNASIEINIPNIIKERIPVSNFVEYPEIAALLLSQIVFHEIGHHVHTFKRYGVKKREIEDFAAKYTEACFYRYLLSRESKILSSYRWGSWDFFRMKKEGRASAREARKEIISWLKQHEDGIPFP